MFDPSLPAAIGGAGPALLTPPYPDHTSGANAYASSSMSAFAAFFGADEMTFYATSSRFPSEQRSFNRFSDVIEVVEARIWAGSTSGVPTSRLQRSAARSRDTSTSTTSAAHLNLHAGSGPGAPPSFASSTAEFDERAAKGQRRRKGFPSQHAPLTAAP